MNNNPLKIIGVLCIILALIMLYFSSLYHFLLFHTIAESISIGIAFAVFLISWNALRYINNNYLILIGIAYLFIAVIDLFHTISYKGMPIFTDYDYYSTQLWIAARYFESFVLLLSFIFVKSKEKVNAYLVLCICTVITLLILLSVYVWKIFPICFIDGQGLTPFKKISEYIICFILLAAIIVLSKSKSAFDEKVYQYLFLSMVSTIISELAFTMYIDTYGLSNLVGHYFKIFSFYLIYKTIIVKGIQEPYEIIFREMKQTEKKLFEQNNILQNLAIIDGLTGLYNHRHLYERLEEESNRCGRNKSCFVTMILDVDNFKDINDNYGHLTGDQILKELSQVLKENIRQTDLVGRYGGDEFLIMLVDVNLEEAYEVAEKIKTNIMLHEFHLKILLTVSIGMEAFSGQRISELLGNADSKLYAAKKSGRNTLVM